MEDSKLEYELVSVPESKSLGRRESNSKKKDSDISENVSFLSQRQKNVEVRQSLYDIYIVESYKQYN